MIEQLPKPFIFYDISQNQVYQFYFSPQTLLSQARREIELAYKLKNFQFMLNDFVQDKSIESMMNLSSILTNQIICICTTEMEQPKRRIKRKKQIKKNKKFKIKIRNHNILSKMLQKLQFQWMCPISHQPMIDPVTTGDGFTYQRENIEEWLSHSNISPMTKLALDSKTLYSNRALKNLQQLIKEGIETKIIESKAEQEEVNEYMSYNINKAEKVFRNLVELHNELQHFLESKIKNSFTDKKDAKTPLDKLQQLICKQQTHISLLKQISNDFNRRQQVNKKIMFTPIYKQFQPYEQIQNQQGYEEYEQNEKNKKDDKDEENKEDLRNEEDKVDEKNEENEEKKFEMSQQERSIAQKNKQIGQIYIKQKYKSSGNYMIWNVLKNLINNVKGLFRELTTDNKTQRSIS